jgi:NAD(P)-dependent dehydrogenase (short-subunit alcohol dehydrogenase family)
VDDLDGKVAVVTGGASGIGRALADRFAAEGMKLVVADIEEGTLDVAAKELTDGGADVLAVPTDVSSPESVDALARATFDRFGTAHVLCNNAGVVSHMRPMWDGPLAEWDWLLGVNLMGVVHGIRAFVPALVEQDEGHVVNTASMAALTAFPFLGRYVASKHAVLGVSEALALELAGLGSAVKVSVLCPAFIQTAIADPDRTWLDRFGSRPAAAEDAGSQFVWELFRTSVEGGLPPAALADHAVDAIRTGRFLVTTHPDLAERVDERRGAQLEGAYPELPDLA